MMCDHFKINVARLDLTHGKRWVHLFATSEHSLRDRGPALDVLALMRVKFPESEGYKVTMTHWQARGEEVSA